MNSNFLFNGQAKTITFSKSIRGKLLFAFLLMSILPLLIVSLFSYRTQQALTQETYNAFQQVTLKVKKG